MIYLFIFIFGFRMVKLMPCLIWETYLKATVAL